MYHNITQLGYRIQMLASCGGSAIDDGEGPTEALKFKQLSLKNVFSFLFWYL